ncbi:MAG: hypothetical protein ACK4PR_09100, partial [Gammaproteobacteria bacterium]
MRKHVLTQAILTVLLSGAVISASATDWSYSGTAGPTNWANLSPLFIGCDAKAVQSPIDINTPITPEMLTVNIDYQPAYFRIYQDVHNIYFINSQFEKDTIIFQHHKYELIQIHFHVPAEHEINGKKYA